MLTMLDVCAGIGGFSLAGDAAGFETIGFIECDPLCRRVLAKHWPGVPQHDDLRAFTAATLAGWGHARLDLLCAGIPCQPRSIAGRRKGAADVRDLWPDTLRVIAEVRPAFVCIENPGGVLSLGLDDWLMDLESAGYDAATVVLPAAAVGAPQFRERVFIVAHTGCVGNERGREPGDVGGEAESRAAEGEEWQRLRDAAGDSRAGVAHANSNRLEERGQCHGQALTGVEPSRRHDAGGCGAVVADAAELGREWRGDAWNGWAGPSDEGPAHRRACATQSGVGGIADGIPARLDRGLTWPGWPARRGEPQYDYEPPRVVRKGAIPNRRKRLRALGNAVVPAAVYPILCAIAEALTAAREETAS